MSRPKSIYELMYPNTFKLTQLQRYIWLASRFPQMFWHIQPHLGADQITIVVNAMGEHQ